MRRLVWLFDVDGTLIRTYGAAREAFQEGVRVLLGVEDALGEVPFAGRTDPLILGDILRKHDRQLGEAETARFWHIVRTRMQAVLETGRGQVLPGVVPLLGAIAREPGWVPALLTGNTAAMARLKLGHFGLADAFVFGAFGDDAPDRDAMARIAVTRARERWGVPPGRCVVVGDTELDIRCARAAEAKVVAVATGVRTRAELEPHAPDLLLDDLADTGALLEWARRVSADGAVP